MIRWSRPIKKIKIFMNDLIDDLVIDQIINLRRPLIRTLIGDQIDESSMIADQLLALIMAM